MPYLCSRRRRGASLLIGLLCCGLVACSGEATPTPTAPNTGATPSRIKLNDTLQRSIAAGQHFDSLVFTLDRPLLIHVDLDAQAATDIAQILYEVTDAVGATLFGHYNFIGDTWGTPGAFSSFWIRVPKGDYHLTVAVPINERYVGPYRIRLLAIDAAPEHAPTRLSFGDSVTETIDGLGDADEFTLVYPRATLGWLTLRALSGGVGDTIGVGYVGSLSSLGGYLKSPANDARQFAAGLVMEHTAADSTIIRVGATTQSASGSYRLSWRRIDPAPENVSAALVAGDTVVSSIEFPGDIDEFTFTGDPAKLYALVAQSTSGRATDPLHFRVVGSTPSYDLVLPGTTPTLLGQMSERFAGGSPLTLRVSADNSAAYGPYRLAVLPIDPGPEHTAGVLSYGDTVSDAIDVIADIDRYTVNTLPGDTVIVYAQTYGDSTAWMHLSVDGFTPVTGPAAQSTTSIDVVPGRLLRGNTTSVLVAKSAGPYTITVVGDNFSNRKYVGAYRLAVTRSSGLPVSVPATMQVNTIVTESQVPPGKLDHFTFNGVAGQEIAVYISPLPGTGGAVTSQVSFALNGGYAFSTAATDSLGQDGTELVTLATTGTQTIDVRVDDTRSSTAGYRIWVYSPDHKPERVSQVVHIGDVISNEPLYPARDIDEFTLTGAPGARFKACLKNLSPDLRGLYIALQVLPPVGVDPSWIIGLFDIPPRLVCTSVNVLPASGTATIKVWAPMSFSDGRYEVSIVSP